MKIVLRGADFTANNIGQISLKDISDISQETLDVLAFYGKDWTDNQKLAIDDFLIRLKAHSAYSYIDYMIAPILVPEEIMPDPSVDLVFKNSKIGYDLISKTVIGSTAGYNSYINKYGLAPMYKKAGQPARVDHVNILSENKQIYTFGLCGYFGYIKDYTLRVSDSDYASGAVNLISLVDITEPTLSDLQPRIVVGARNASTMRAVKNGVYNGTPKEFCSDVYNGNTYTGKEICSATVYSETSVATINHTTSLFFYCSGYMMTEQELKDMESLCRNFILALWG